MTKKRLAAALAAVLLVLLYVGVSAYLKTQVVERINEFAASAGFSEKIRYEALSVNPVTMSGKLKQVDFEDSGLYFKAESLDFNIVTYKSKIKDITIANGDEFIKIDEIYVKKYKTEDGIPKNTEINVSALRLPVDSPEMTAKLGTDELVVDIELATDADFTKQIYEYTRMNFFFRDLADVKINLTFSGVDIKSYAKFSSGNTNALQDDAEFNAKVQEDLANLKLNSLTLTMKDKGAAEKLFFTPEEGDNSTPEERRQKFIAELDQDIAETESPFEKQLAEDIKKALQENRKEIVLTMKPAEPVSLQELMLSSMMGAGMDEIAGMTALKYEFK